MGRTKTIVIIRSALLRIGMTAEELCRLAAIPPRTYYSHLKAGRFTQAELRRIDRVLHFEDGELITIIRG